MSNTRVIKHPVSSASLLFLVSFAAFCGGCKAAEEKAAPPPVAQTAPRTGQPALSPEAAKAAEAAMRRDKEGY